MSRQFQSEMSTKLMKKAKLLDSFRQAPTNRNKVMLTDLCAQEKAKIGDLVRTLETRKSEKSELEKKFSEMEKVEQQYLKKIEQMERMIDENRRKEMKLMEEITLCKIKQQQREKYIRHLLDEKQKNETELKLKQAIAHVDQFALTDSTLTLSYGCQTTSKKKKQKSVQVQTEAENAKGSRVYPNNSKSFQKIMRGKPAETHPSQIDWNKVEIGSKQRQPQFYTEIRANSEWNKQQFSNDENQQGDQFVKTSYQAKPKQEQENIGEDQDFNELAKKWLQLKQKNMSKIKQSYQKSKEKIDKSSNGKSYRDISRSVVPQEFDEKNIVDQDFEKVNYSPQIEHMKIDDNQSFGPKVSKRFSKIQQDQTEEINQDFDDIQLNRILKSENFSASRLLNKNRMSQQVNKRNRKNERFQNDSHIKRSNMKLSSASSERSNQIDFCQTNLLDIVGSRKRQ